MMQLGLSLGYWGAQPPTEMVPLVLEAERLDYDAVWTAESWGSDAFSPLVFLAAHTERIRLGTGIVQMSARTPTATAMHAVTLDHLSNGRLILGLGVSGPQVVEGWYGQPSNRPLARTREYVEILRRAFQRDDHLSFDGDFYQLPYTGDGSTGLGKPLKVMTHPLRADIPIFIGAEGPRNVTQTAQIADGWLPLYYSPYRQEVYADQLVDRPDHFEVALNLCRHPHRRQFRRLHIGSALPGEGHARLLHRRHGGQGPELPHEADGPDGLRGRGTPDPGPLPGGSS